MPENVEQVPIIDFSVLSTNMKETDLNSEVVKSMSKTIIEAFKTTGFLYIKNTELKKEEVESVNKAARSFFRQGNEQKEKFSRGIVNGGEHGWTGFKKESLDPGKPGDLKESFNVILSEVRSENLEWPSNDFETEMTNCFEKLKSIALRFLTLLAIGLDLAPDFFTQYYSGIGQNINITAMRCNYYPELSNSEVKQVKQGQIRCGEHSDYCTITLLISEDISGLQVKNRDGNYVNLSKADDASYILVNLGDLMQRWTNDQLTSAKHRVIFDKDLSDGQGIPERQSIAYFVFPNHETVIKPYDKDPKYEPVTSIEYLMKKLSAIY